MCCAAVKMTVFAPMPSASEPTAMAVKPGLFASMRRAMTQIAAQLVEETGAPRLTGIFPYRGNAAQLGARAAQSFIAGQAGTHQILGIALDVEAAAPR